MESIDGEDDGCSGAGTAAAAGGGGAGSDHHHHYQQHQRREDDMSRFSMLSYSMLRVVSYILLFYVPMTFLLLRPSIVPSTIQYFMILYCSMLCFC